MNVAERWERTQRPRLGWRWGHWEPEKKPSPPNSIRRNSPTSMASSLWAYPIEMSSKLTGETPASLFLHFSVSLLNRVLCRANWNGFWSFKPIFLINILFKHAFYSLNSILPINLPYFDIDQNQFNRWLNLLSLFYQIECHQFWIFQILLKHDLYSLDLIIQINPHCLNINKKETNVNIGFLLPFL